MPGHSLPAFSRGRAAPMLELVTHSISFLLLAGRPVVRGRTFPSREPASRQPSPSHVHDLELVPCPSRRPTRGSCRRGLWIPSAGRERRASPGPKRAYCLCRLLRRDWALKKYGAQPWIMPYEIVHKAMNAPITKNAVRLPPSLPSENTA